MLPNKNSEKPAKINLHNISNYLSAKIRIVKIKLYEYFSINNNNKLSNNDPFLHEKEQIMWRGEISEKIGSCKSNKYCTFCGCETEGEGSKYYGWAGCEKEGCYPEMMTRDEWNRFKKENNIMI